MTTATTPETAAIEMHGVTAGSMKNPGQTVLEDINWTVRQGEFWVVAGGQRSAKTDFLMLTGGLMSPMHGSYQLNGQTMPIFEDDRLSERLKIGVVFDGGQLFNRLTIRENVMLPLRYHRELTDETIRTRTEALLKATRLSALADSRPSALGWSLQKQAGLARALALGPEVLLLDNPLSGMSPRLTHWWLGLMNELWHGHELLEGKPLTLVATTDDLRPWRGGEQQFAYLSKGRFKVLGGWAEVERCADPAVQDLLHDRPVEKPEERETVQEQTLKEE